MDGDAPSRPTRRTVLGFGAGTLAGLAGCVAGSSSTPRKADYDVGMSAIEFLPARLEVTVGTEVTWKNTNTRTHTVTAYEDGIPPAAEYFATGGYDSQAAAESAYYNALEGGLVTDQTFSHTFEVPGEYAYFCIPHREAGMAGTIVVRPEGEGTTET
ncbi:MAG: plastocyanin/azurin family copper-binding protein [Halobacteriaceae archaeon]